MDSKNISSEKLLLGITEVAALLSLGRSKTYALIAAGELPSIRLGKSVRVPAQKLREWVQERSQAGAA